MNENYHSTDFTDKKVIDHCQWSLGEVFGLWRLVFGLIYYNDMSIVPKTKDLALKTDTVFGLWWLVFGLINYNNMSIMLKTKTIR